MNGTYSVPQFCEHFNISQQYVSRLIAAGRVLATRTGDNRGNRWRIHALVIAPSPRPRGRPKKSA